MHPVFVWIVQGLGKTWGKRILNVFRRKPKGGEGEDSKV